MNVGRGVGVPTKSPRCGGESPLLGPRSLGFWPQRASDHKLAAFLQVVLSGNQAKSWIEPWEVLQPGAPGLSSYGTFTNLFGNVPGEHNGR